VTAVFCLPQDLPCEISRSKPGLIVADAYGAHLHARRRSIGCRATASWMTVRFAMAAAQRINRLVRPAGHGEF